MNSQRTKYFALSLGIASLGSQVILMRQCLTVFYGNELFIGFILAIWLTWVAIGSVGAQRLGRRYSPSVRLAQWMIAVALFSTVFAVLLFKWVRVLLSVPPAEFVPLSQAILFLVIIMALPCFLYGALFGVIAILFKADRGEAAAWVFAYEAGAALFIGIVTTLLAPVTSNLYLLSIVIVIVFIAIAVPFKSWFLLAASIAILFLGVCSIPGKLETIAQQIYWRSFGEGMELSAWTSTAYGESNIVSWFGQQNYYQNGLHVATLDDSVNIQQQAALIMASQRPKRMLFIEGSASGLAEECRRFGAEVEGVTLDKNALSFVHSHMPHKSTFDLSGVAWHFGDPRRFLQRSEQKWDTIVLSIGSPLSAAANKYYTREFFKVVESHLNADGVLIITGFPAGENYIGQHFLELNKILVNTLQPFFERVTILPFDKAFYFAGRSATSFSLRYGDLVRRYAGYGVQQEFFAPEMFSYLVDHARMKKMLQKILMCPAARINSDFKPAAYLYDLLIWQKTVQGEHRWLDSIVKWGERPSALYLLGAGIWVIIGLAAFRGGRVFSVHVVTATVGYAAMAFNIVLILAFQTLYGAIYLWLGMVTAAYMLGTAVASGVVNQHIKRLPVTRLLIILLLAFVFSGLLFLPAVSSFAHWWGMFFILVAFVGAVAGGAFPLFCDEYTRLTKRINYSSLYAADVAGAALAALLVTSVIVPLGGFQAALASASMACFTGIVIMLWAA